MWKYRMCRSVTHTWVEACERVDMGAIEGAHIWDMCVYVEEWACGGKIRDSTNR